MVVYRIDLLDEEGRISLSDTLDSGNDRDALHAAARVIGRHHALEIWDQTRVVGQLTAKDCERLKRHPARPRPDVGIARAAMTG
jgi:DNA-binding transcriptional regulator/RsmH inhibitor MraZ